MLMRRYALGAECADSVAGSVHSGEMISMAETQGDIYVRKDVFDARMDRLEMLLEKTTVEIKSYVDKSMAEIRTYVDKSTGEAKSYVEKAVGEIKTEVQEIKAEVQQNRNDIKALTVRIDALEQTLGARIGSVENMLTWCIGLFALLIAVVAFLTPIASAIKKVFKPLTLKDMERVAESVSERVAERVANAVIERHLSGGK